MTAVLTEKNFANAPIQEGDAGLILKPDGTFQIFTTGEIDPKGLTDVQMDQAIRLNCLALALTSEEIMEMLIRIVESEEMDGKRIQIGNTN